LELALVRQGVRRHHRRGAGGIAKVVRRGEVRLRDAVRRPVTGGILAARSRVAADIVLGPVRDDMAASAPAFQAGLADALLGLMAAFQKGLLPEAAAQREVLRAGWSQMAVGAKAPQGAGRSERGMLALEPSFRARRLQVSLPGAEQLAVPPVSLDALRTPLQELRPWRPEPQELPAVLAAAL
jgi:hypothetical protein